MTGGTQKASSRFGPLPYPKVKPNPIYLHPFLEPLHGRVEPCTLPDRAAGTRRASFTLRRPVDGFLYLSHLSADFWHFWVANEARGGVFYELSVELIAG